MGKIKKTPSDKHNATLCPAVESFVKTSTSIPLYQLPAHLATFPRTWPLPRGDFHHWIPTLNRFDTVLELFNERYELDKGPQSQIITRQVLRTGDKTSSTDTEISEDVLDQSGYSSDGDRELIEAILAFTRLLFERCGSRSLYSSSAHISNILNSTSLSLVHLALRLGLCLAQRYSSSRARSGPHHHHHQLNQNLLASHYAFALENIESLAQPFTKSLSAVDDLEIVVKDVEKNSVVMTHAPDLLTSVREDDNAETSWEDYGGAWISFDDLSNSGTRPATTNNEGQASLSRSNHNLPPSSPTDAVTNNGSSDNVRKDRSTLLEIPFRQISSQSTEKLLKDTLPRVPTEKRYELLDKVRTAHALTTSTRTRQQLVAIRLLAIANLAHVYPEGLLQAKVLQHESEGPRSSQLPQQLCDLVHPPGGGSPGIPKQLQTVALLTLAALTKHKTRASDVSAALSVNVSHGMLSFVARKGVTELESEETGVEDLDDREWRDSLFSLLHELPKSNTRVADGFVSGGLLEILVESLTYRTNKAEANHPRVLKFLDYFIFNKREAFQSLANTKGLDAISDLMNFEVKSSSSAIAEGQRFPTEFKSRNTDFQIPFLYQQTLCQLLRFVNHMIANSQGAFDRQVRNLIESSQLLGSLKVLMQNPFSYGSEVWSQTVSVFSTFLHNEPTSFTTMAEAGVSQAFLETITQKKLSSVHLDSSSSAITSSSNTAAKLNGDDNGAPGVLPTMEVINCLPEAFGAICLVEAGMRQFESSEALETFFKIFTSPTHLKCLVDPHADVEDLGTSLDELARHHPRLKPTIVKNISTVARTISKMYAKPSRPMGARLFFDKGDTTPMEVPAQQSSSGHETNMGPQMNTRQDGPDHDIVMLGENDIGPQSTVSKDVSAEASQRIGVFSHLLFGFLINANMITPFSETSGIEDLLDLATSPVLPYDFHGGGPGHSPGHAAVSKLIQVFHNLIDHKAHMVLPSIVRRALEEMNKLEQFWDYAGEGSYFAKYLNLSAEDVTESDMTNDIGTTTIKSFLNLQTLCNILSKSLTPMNSRSNPNSFAGVNLADMYATLIPSLGRLQSKCLWEFMEMQPLIPSSFKQPDLPGANDASQATGTENGQAQANTQPNPSAGLESSLAQEFSTLLDRNSMAIETEHTERRIFSTSNDGRSASTCEERNYLVIRYFLRQLPPVIASLFATIGKSLVVRRGQMDAYQKQNMLLVADRIAEALSTQLDDVEVRDFSSASADFVRYICLTHIGRSILDKRAEAIDRGGSQILTMVINAFKKRDGFVKLGKLLLQLFERATELLKTSQEARSSRHVNLAFSSIDVMLKMFANLTNDKKVSEAQQTIALSSRVDRDKDRPDFFLPSQFLIELRYEATEAILPIWNSEAVEHLGCNTVKTLTEIFRNVLEGEGESNAFKRSDKAPEPGNPPRKRWKLRNTENLTRLIERGYSQDLAQEALYRCNEGSPSSQEYCAAYMRNPSLPRIPIPSYDAPVTADVTPTSQTPDEPAEHTTPEVSSTNSNTAAVASQDHSAELSTFPASTESQPTNIIPPPNVDAPQETERFNNSTGSLDLPKPLYLVRVEDLEDKRTELRDGLMDRCLTVSKTFTTLTFDLADLIIASVSKSQDPSNMRQEICETLTHSLISLQGSGSLQANAQKIAADAHLLGVVLQEKDFFEAAKENLRDSLSGLLGFLKLGPDQKLDESASWIPRVLLIIEKVMAEDAQPQQIQWTPPTGDQPQVSNVAELPEPLVPPEEKQALFGMLIELLPRIGKNPHLGLAVVRTLVPLTRDRNLAKEIGTRRNMQRLFVMVKQLAGHFDDKFHADLMIVLRHVVEDDDTIRHIMRSEVKTLFEKPPRQIDTTTYTRTLYHLVLRAPTIFVEITNELLMLPKFDRNQNPQTLALKTDSISHESLEGVSNSDEAVDGMENNEVGAGAVQRSMEVDQMVNPASSMEPVKGPTVANPDGVIHFLLSELLTYREVPDKEPLNTQDSKAPEDTTDVEMKEDVANSGISTGSARTASDSTGSKSQFKAEDHPIYIYRCFILQCLTELLQSYNKTKIEFTNYSRKADPHAATPSKPHSGVLNYLLNTLIPVGTLDHPNDIPSRKQAATSNWAVKVISALCSHTSEKGSPPRRSGMQREDEPDLIFVRKFVLEHVMRAFRDANASTDPFDLKYSRMLSIADLLNSMLAERLHDPSMRAVREQRDDALAPTQRGLAKIMFEKNFISALTSSIADVDLNTTGANRVVKHILRPLKLLTQTAIELSMTSELSSTPGQTEEDEISSATSVSDLADDREETPDLFRHSTLGMFEPGREDEPSSESEDEDEEMYGDDYDDEMDYPEEGEVEDDEVSDEDAEMTGIGPVEGLHGDVNMDVEIELEEDDVSTSDDDDDDDDDDDEDDDDDDESEPHSSDDDDEEEEIDEEIEVVEEDLEDDFVDGEHAEEEDWQHEDEHMPFSIRRGDPPQPLSVSESRSERDMALITGPGNPLDAELEIEADHGGSHDGDSDGEAEDDEDDFDEDEERELHDHPDYDMEEDDVPPWFWPITPGRRPRGSHHHHFGRIHRESYFVPPSDRFSSYRTHRTGGPPNADDGMNPLLQRSRSTNNNIGWPSAPIGTGNRPSIFDELGELSRRLPPIGSNNPMSYLSELLQALGRGGPGQLPTHHHHQDGSIHFSIPAVPGGNFTLGLPPPDMDALVEMRQDVPNRNNALDPGNAVSFLPSLTTERWQAEARLLFGSSYIEKCSKVINSILQLLVPPAIEAERIQKEKEAEVIKRSEEEKERRRIEAAAKEKQEREEREAQEKAEADARAAEAAAAAEVEAAQRATGEETDLAEATQVTGEAMEGIEATTSQAPQDGSHSGTSTNATPRVYTNIRGRQLDITDLGIDLTYLEALPEEMREEVIMQQYAEQRSQAAAAGEEPTAINSEFLDALPPDIREELLQQEAQDRRRREREEARRQSAAMNGGTAQPAEMDPASFITSLDPVLRQSVLAEADDEMLASLPPEFVAEARALGGHRRRPLDPARLLGDLEFQDGQPRRAHEEAIQRAMEIGNRPRRGVVVQMLDRAGVATLLRLMFVPVAGNARQNLNSILRNVCGNRQTRGEVVSGLLSILQEGSIDVSAVERSFTQLTLKAKQLGAQKAQQQKGKAAFVANIADSSPLTVIGQCLNALVFLTQTVTHISHFFLSENESFGVFKSKSNKKGKAKEAKGNKYPINALLSLLDRKVVVENAAVIEQLAGLLQTVTQPLNTIKQSREQSANANGEPAAAGLGVRVEEQPRGDASTNVTSETGDTTATTITHSEAHTGQDISAPTETDTSAEAPPASATGPSTETKAQDKETEVKKSRPLTPPQIPEENLRLIINILMARDCSSKTFRDTLSLMTNLSTIPDAKKIFGDELVKCARDLGQKIFTDLLKLIKSLKGAENEMQAQSLALANFSPAGSDQSKFNRILTALDYLFDVKSHDDKESKAEEEAKAARTGQDLLANLNDDPSFGKLWGELSEALSATQQSGHYFFNVATILLPLIEALMVVCKRLPLKESAYLANRHELGSPMSEVNMMVRIFFSFTNRHKKILNDLVRHTPKLMSGSFASLVKNPSVLEFDNKRNYFTRRLHQRSSTTRNTHPTLQLNVRRDQVFSDSYAAMHFKSANEIKYGKLHIRFHNEEGVDAGGVTREWFSVLARQMFNPDYALFNPVASDKTTFHPNPLSEINDQHLHFFKFIGRIIGKALYENRVLDCHFSRAVYKRILGKPVSIRDMETIDLDYSKSMEWILENDITDIITETFSIAFDRFGVEQIVDLVPNGRNIAVTEENKHEFVRLVIEYKLTGAVKEQLGSFLSGFHDIVPPELISIFDENELELLISGMPDVDVDDWKNNTEYHNYNANSPQVQWFWRAVRSFDKEERAKLLQFVTGAGKVPLNGFKELEGMNGITRFSIHKDYGNKDRLPSSHTCFNQLDLPEYDSYENLRKNLYTAMTTGNEYFGYA